MTKAQMQHFFEQCYQKLVQNDMNVLPNIPTAMQANPHETTEWKHWKLVPALCTEEDFTDLEEELDIQLPMVLKLFLSTYHHYFEAPIGKNPITEPFSALYHAYNPILIQHQYLPFTWDKDDAYIRCICLEHMPDEHRCPIYEIDHEILFDFDEDDETIQTADIAKHMHFVADNFESYLQKCLEEMP